jgi:cell shape-determining protein MreC
MVSDPIRETGLLNGQGAGALPLVSLIADTPGFGTPEDGDVVMTAGGTNGLAPPGVLLGVVADVDQGSPSEGLLLHVRPFANVDGLDLVHVILYQPPSEAGSETDAN